MYQRRRKLKKEKSKEKVKLAFMALLFLLLFLGLLEFIFLNFSFGKGKYLNPLAKSKSSNTQMVENMLYESKISFSSAQENSDGSFTINLKDGAVVILSPKKDVKNQLSSLQLILSRLTIEGKKLKNLDFRYDNPVVSF